jgi:hypothetical protein
VSLSENIPRYYDDENVYTEIGEKIVVPDAGTYIISPANLLNQNVSNLSMPPDDDPMYVAEAAFFAGDNNSLVLVSNSRPSMSMQAAGASLNLTQSIFLNEGSSVPYVNVPAAAELVTSSPILPHQSDFTVILAAKIKGPLAPPTETQILCSLSGDTETHAFYIRNSTQREGVLQFFVGEIHELALPRLETPEQALIIGVRVAHTSAFVSVLSVFINGRLAKNYYLSENVNNKSVGLAGILKIGDTTNSVDCMELARLTLHHGALSDSECYQMSRHLSFSKALNVDSDWLARNAAAISIHQSTASTLGSMPAVSGYAQGNSLYALTNPNAGTRPELEDGLQKFIGTTSFLQTGIFPAALEPVGVILNVRLPNVGAGAALTPNPLLELRDATGQSLGAIRITVPTANSVRFELAPEGPDQPNEGAVCTLSNVSSSSDIRLALTLDRGLLSLLATVGTSSASTSIERISLLSPRQVVLGRAANNVSPIPFHLSHVATTSNVPSFYTIYNIFQDLIG